MITQNTVSENAAPSLIFACSGAADVGAVADQAARKLTRYGMGKMYCLAGVGGRVKPIMDTTAKAPSVLAIDGCEHECVKCCLQAAGFGDFHHLRLSDLGMEKGKTAVTDENIGRVVTAAAELISHAMLKSNS